MFRDIATAQYPLRELVSFALKQKGAELRPDTITRYTEMLETAILIDDGEDLRGDVAEFVNALPAHNKFAAVIQSLGETLGASSEEINQFIKLLTRICSGSLNPDSPLSGKLPLEGDCLDEETTFIFPRVQTGSCGDGAGSRVFLS